MSTPGAVRKKKIAGNLRRLRRRVFAFASPVAIFIPREREVLDESGNTVMKRDSNLFFVALAAFTTSSLMVSQSCHLG